MSLRTMSSRPKNPFAGKIDICCFDKTGTLTQTDLIIKGYTAIGTTSNEKQRIITPDNIYSADRLCATVIGGCHTLAFTDDNLVGDPLEK